jgi:ubiquinone biosynthesis monooxygenase Coq7
MLSVHNEPPSRLLHANRYDTQMSEAGAALLHYAEITTRSGPKKMIDQLLVAADNTLKTLSGASHAARPSPAQDSAPADALTDEERRHAGGLMRVNHVGEVCAQALYQAQALTTRDPALKHHFETAAREETDHLAWTQQRLRELGAQPSILNPLWYVGAFGIGLVAGRIGDAVSLGFVVETERQVEQHLESHLSQLPASDTRSQAVVRQMKDDEARHAASAREAGAVELPLPVRWAMRAAAKVMTTTAYRL